MMRNGVLLLVEDNPDDEELALRAFRKSKLVSRIDVARDGQEALEYLLAGDTDGSAREIPDLMLLDLNLPKLGGLEVLRRLRADPRTKWVPVVVLTSSTEDSDIARSYNLGANGFVRKPVDFTEFVETVRQLTTYWLAVNLPPPRPAGACPSASRLKEAERDDSVAVSL